MSLDQAVAPFTAAQAKDLSDAGGITQFIGGTGAYHTINGLTFQAGKVAGPLAVGLPGTVNFHQAFPVQVLGVWLTPISTNPGSIVGLDAAASLSSFIPRVSGATLTEGFYWLAIGV